jgi:hypothetical protein
VVHISNVTILPAVQVHITSWLPIMPLHGGQPTLRVEGLAKLLSGGLLSFQLRRCYPCTLQNQKGVSCAASLVWKC